MGATIKVQNITPRSVKLSTVSAGNHVVFGEREAIKFRDRVALVNAQQAILLDTGEVISKSADYEVYVLSKLTFTYSLL